MKIVFSKKDSPKKLVINTCSYIKSDFIDGILFIDLGFRTPETADMFHKEFIANTYSTFRDDDLNYYYVVVKCDTNIIFEVTI